MDWAHARCNSIRVRLAPRSAPWSLRGRLLRRVLSLKTLQRVAILWWCPRWLMSDAVPGSEPPLTPKFIPLHIRYFLPTGLGRRQVPTGHMVGRRPCLSDLLVPSTICIYPVRRSRHRSRVRHFEYLKTGRMWLGEHSVPLRYGSAQAQFMRYRLSNG
jgi:hypothetical protein